MKTVETVALIVLDGDRMLLERRGLDKETFPGVVVVPGGHVEKGETLEEACKRELKEELDLESSKFRFLEMHPFETPIEVQHVHYFVCEDWKGTPRSHEADEVFFVGFDELNRVDVLEERELLQKHFR
jgi:mutator protein MutT